MCYSPRVNRNDKHSANGNTAVQGVEFQDVRTTIVMPHALDRNIQILSVQQDKTKNDIIKEALRQYVLEHKLNPDALPRLVAIYD